MAEASSPHPPLEDAKAIARLERLEHTIDNIMRVLAPRPTDDDAPPAKRARVSGSAGAAAAAAAGPEEAGPLEWAVLPPSPHTGAAPPVPTLEPNAPPAAYRMLGNASPPRLTHNAGTHVLIVDDSYSIRRYLQGSFSRKGYTVETAADGWQAISRMQSHLYAAVFMDLEMPVMNGYRCVQAIREWEASVNRPTRQFICALTSHKDPNEVKLCTDVGMDSFESKPASLHRLTNIIEAVPAVAAVAPVSAAAAAADDGAGEDFALGENCQVRYPGTDRWLDATVLRRRSGGDTYDVAYDDDGEHEAAVPRRRLRDATAAAPDGAFTADEVVDAPCKRRFGAVLAAVVVGAASEDSVVLRFLRSEGATPDAASAAHFVETVPVESVLRQFRRTTALS